MDPANLVQEILVAIPSLSALGDSLSIISFCTTLIQWFLASKDAGKRQTVEDYLEWLRRHDHQELRSAIQGNAERLNSVASVIEDVQDAILSAIAAHESNAVARHDELLKNLDKLNVPAAPKLRIIINSQPATGITVAHPGKSAGSVSANYTASVTVINDGNGYADITNARAVFLIGNSFLAARLDHRGKITIGPGGQSERIVLKSVFIDGPPNNGKIAKLMLYAPQLPDGEVHFQFNV